LIVFLDFIKGSLRFEKRFEFKPPEFVVTNY